MLMTFSKMASALTVNDLQCAKTGRNQHIAPSVNNMDTSHATALPHSTLVALAVVTTAPLSALPITQRVVLIARALLT
jgi:hypothetical protein